MDDELHALADQQGGVLRRSQLRRAGVPAHRLGTPDDPREHVRLRHGVYVEASRLAGAGEAEHTALLVAAERLRTGVDLIAVGPTAARVQALPVLGRPGGLHLAERKPVRPRHHGGSRTVEPDDVVEVLGVPVTVPARTAVDVGRRGLAAGVVTADGVLRSGIAREELERALDRIRRWPGRATAVQVVALADARAESALESLGRVRFHEHGLPAPDLQVWVGDAEGPFARVDQYWPQHRTVAEADGALKYGVSGALFEEKLREDRLREAGFEVVRYTWDEALRRPHEVVRRVLRAFDRAEHRRAA